MSYKNLTWKKLSSKYLHKGPWATLRSDRCMMPDGRLVEDYYVLEYPNWVNAVALTEDNKIIMVYQYRHAAEIVSLEIPGGVIEAGESPTEALRRELLEETGFEAATFEPLAMLACEPARNSARAHFFFARGGVRSAAQALDHSEELEVLVVPVSDVLALIENGHIVHAAHVAAILLAMRRGWL